MNLSNFYELTPGTFVINNDNNDWGIGQVQSSIQNIVTVNFENVGKKVINVNKIKLKVYNIK